MTTIAYLRISTADKGIEKTKPIFYIWQMRGI